MAFDEYPDFGESNMVWGEVYRNKGGILVYFPKKLAIFSKGIETRNASMQDLCLVTGNFLRVLEEKVKGKEPLKVIEVDGFKLEEIVLAMGGGREEDAIKSAANLIDEEEVLEEDNLPWGL